MKKILNISLILIVMLFILPLNRISAKDISLQEIKNVITELYNESHNYHKKEIEDLSFTSLSILDNGDNTKLTISARKPLSPKLEYLNIEAIEYKTSSYTYEMGKTRYSESWPIRNTFEIVMCNLRLLPVILGHSEEGQILENECGIELFEGKRYFVLTILFKYSSPIKAKFRLNLDNLEIASKEFHFLETNMRAEDIVASRKTIFGQRIETSNNITLYDARGDIINKITRSSYSIKINGREE